MSTSTSAGREKFLKYYCADQALLCEDELPEFVRTLDEPLPITFWISPASRVDKVLEELSSDSHLIARNFLRPLRWETELRAFSIELSRKELRKTSELSHFRELLVNYSEVGIVWRQEECSMLPVHFLDVRRGDRCLDMCAAPGSKTAQLLAFLGEKNRASIHGQSIGFDFDEHVGYVLANDSNCKRLDMLIHRIKNMTAYFPYAIFTNHDARFFPTRPTFDKPSDTAGQRCAHANRSFNKILCDVPCTGDGTYRKNVHALRCWNEANAFLLNPLQLDIGMKAAFLLEQDGLMVYSTCSLNPIENEAVIYSLLRLCKESLILVPPSEYSMVSLSGESGKFNVRSGLSHWNVNTSLREQNLNRALPLCCRGERFDTYSPPKEGEGSLNLENTMRIYPHVQNTGGFFIAVLKKVKPLPEDITKTILQRLGSRMPRDFGTDEPEAPRFVRAQTVFNEISEFYSFPALTHLLSCGELISFSPNKDNDVQHGRKLNFVSRSAFEAIREVGNAWNVVNIGLRVFSFDRLTKIHDAFPWRITNECVQLISQVIGENGFCIPERTVGPYRIVRLSTNAARDLLLSPRKSFLKERLSEIFKEEGGRISSLSIGGCIFCLVGSTCVFRAFSGYITPYSIQSSIANRELPAYLHAFRTAAGNSSRADPS